MGISNSSFKRNGRRPTLMSEINITPFVDVMLVLLVVFMTTTPMLTVTIPLNLPKTELNKPTTTSDPLVISLDQSGKIFLQEEETNLEQLIAKLKAISVINKDMKLFLRADKDLSYGKVIEVMGNLTSQGFNQLSLVTEPK